MSTSLYWKPVLDNKETLPDALKFIVREHYRLPCVVNQTDTGFFRGLAAANIKGAKEVLELIKKHGEIELSEYR